VSEQGWSEDYWNKFLSKHWERRPARLEVPPWGRFCNLEELFDTILSARGSKRLKSDRFWVARKSVPGEIDDYRFVSLDLFGPRLSDGNFDGFFARMHGRCFGINLHRLGNFRQALMESLAYPIKRLENVPGTGLVRRWDLDTFFGNYQMTPFGIHQDRASVFSFCLQGERTYLTWPPDYPWAPDDLFVPDQSRLERHRRTAESFHIQAGDFFYWPSNRWHVVCSDGRPSVVVQLSGYF